jgi:glutamate/tyrosine decarboxylase-like PLP-dependent enzyme
MTTRRRTALHIDPAEFRRLGHHLVDEISKLLAGLPERPVTFVESPEETRRALGHDAPLPVRGENPEVLLDRAMKLLRDHSLFNGHPRFLGYITASPAPIGILGDFLAAAVNPNVGGWTIGPMATEIESQTVRWIAELLGFPTTCGGLLLSGGNMANFTCFWAARVAQAGPRVRERGLAGVGGDRLRVYASAETHTWLQKAMDLSGLGTDAARWIPTDAQQRMDLHALRQAIAADRAAGLKPFLVIGTGGSVSTGAIDPLPELAEICREHDAWFHVDGAYGGFAACLPDAPEDLRALARADSVAIDPHKWLYAPLEAGCALVRDPDCLRAAFSYHPPYYHFGFEATNYVDFGPQNSRGFRALKVWLSLGHAGRDGYRQSIAEDIRLAARLHAAAGRHPELEPRTLSLSIATFRFVPADLRPRRTETPVAEYLDALNREVLDRVQKGGALFVSNAVVSGTYWLRACVVNLNTSESDIDAVPELVAQIGRATDAEQRPEALRPRTSSTRS